MVDPYTGEGRVVDEASGDRVDHLRDIGMLGTDGDEVVDREEPPDVAGRVAPPLQPVVLTGDRVVDVEVFGAGSQGKSQRPVPHLGPAVALADRERARGEHLIERVAELGHDHRAIGCRPVDVEPRRRRRIRALAKHLPPAVVEVGLGDRHVVRYVIDDDAESTVVGGSEERKQPLLATELPRTTAWSITS